MKPWILCVTTAAMVWSTTGCEPVDDGESRSATGGGAPDPFQSSEAPATDGQGNFVPDHYLQVTGAVAGDCEAPAEVAAAVDLLGVFVHVTDSWTFGEITSVAMVPCDDVDPGSCAGQQPWWQLSDGLDMEGPGSWEGSVGPDGCVLTAEWRSWEGPMDAPTHRTISQHLEVLGDVEDCALEADLRDFFNEEPRPDTCVSLESWTFERVE